MSHGRTSARAAQRRRHRILSPAQSPPAPLPQRRRLDAALARLFPITAQTSNRPEQPSAPNKRTFAHLLVPLAVLAALLVWQALAPAAQSDRTAAPAGPKVTTAASSDVDAVIATIAQLNAAETQVAATLDIAPLTPYLDQDGPLLARRQAQLALRRARQAPHETRLLSWTVGEVAMRGGTATVATQEVWENREAGAAAPSRATVRVSYSLRRDETTGRWLVVDTQQVRL